MVVELMGGTLMTKPGPPEAALIRRGWRRGAGRVTVSVGTLRQCGVEEATAVEFDGRVIESGFEAIAQVVPILPHPQFTIIRQFGADGSRIVAGILRRQTGGDRVVESNGVGAGVDLTGVIVTPIPGLAAGIATDIGENVPIVGIVSVPLRSVAAGGQRGAGTERTADAREFAR